MSKAKRQWYIIAYDIRNPKRLRRTHYQLRKQAIALQKSVFLLHATPQFLKKTLKHIGSIIHAEDDVRIYPIYRPETLWTAGKQSQATEGVYASPTSTDQAKKRNQQKLGLFSRFFRRKS